MTRLNLSLLIVPEGRRRHAAAMFVLLMRQLAEAVPAPAMAVSSRAKVCTVLQVAKSGFLKPGPGSGSFSVTEAGCRQKTNLKT